MKITELVLESYQLLDEVAMSPSSLSQEAAKIGATAGMEFEMIVPDVTVNDDDEQEPDFDSDERVTDFDSIAEFFSNGDMNSRRDIDNLIGGLKEDYYNYASELREEQWNSEKYDFFKDYFTLNEFDEDGAKEQATEEIKEANPELPEDSKDFENLVSARVDEILDEQLDEVWDDGGRIYDDAHSEWEQDADWPDEQDFLRREGYRYMSDIHYMDYDVYWPYMTSAGDSKIEIDQVADDFSRAIGRPVNASLQYHGGRREAGHYVVEPDGSLDADDDSDAGLEFISPPLPLDDMLNDLNKTIAWAKKYGCYTNDSTGLHMNVSIPNYSRENLDYVKLAILLGDQYVLQQFGRLSNTYTKSALGKVKDIIQSRPEQTSQALAKMKNSLASEAARVIHSGTTDKYTSINTKDGYIEFRSPGGDWLDADIPKLENTLLRFVVAMDAACDPNKYRQEYLKKLYKLLEPTSDEYGIMVKNFSDYVAGVGGAPEQVVKDFRRTALSNLQQASLTKKATQGQLKGPYWWSVSRPGYFASVNVVANSKEEAIQKGKVEYPDWRNAENIEAKPLRPYIDTPQPQQPTQQPQQQEPTHPEPQRWTILNAAGNPVGTVTARYQSSAEELARRFLVGNNPNINTSEFSVEPEQS
jgi:hypothetical protein